MYEDILYDDLNSIINKKLEIKNYSQLSPEAKEQLISDISNELQISI